MFVLYSADFNTTLAAYDRAKAGGDRIRPLPSKIKSTNSDNRLALLYFAAITRGDAMTADTIARKGVSKGFWQDVPTEGVDFRIKPSGREHASQRLCDYLGVTQDERFAQVLSKPGDDTQEASTDDANGGENAPDVDENSTDDTNGDDA